MLVTASSSSKNFCASDEPINTKVESISLMPVLKDSGDDEAPHLGNYADGGRATQGRHDLHRTARKDAQLIGQSFAQNNSRQKNGPVFDLDRMLGF